MLGTFEVVALSDDPADQPSSPQGPHGLRIVTSMREGWDLIKVVGDIRPIDVPSLAMASRHAFRRRPPRLEVDLTDVAECDTAGIHWLQAVGNSIVSCGGEFRVAVVVAKPLGHLLQSSGIEVHDQSET